jgi:putative flippase GtrA
VLAGPLGLALADLVALALCSVANTAANRRLTFSLQGRPGRTRQYAGGLALSALPVALTLVTLLALSVLGVGTLWVQVTMLAVASATAALGRFVALRRWVFRP